MAFHLFLLLISLIFFFFFFFFFFQAEDGIRDHCVTGVQTCALPISVGVTAPPTARHSGTESAVRRRPGSPKRADRKSTCLNSSHTVISYAVFCLKKKKKDDLLHLEQHSYIISALTAMHNIGHVIYKC